MKRRDQDPQAPIPESPLRAYIEHQRAFFQEQFTDNQEDLPAIKKALVFLEQGDAKNHKEVGYHGPEHVLSMARFAVQTIDTAEFQELLSRLNLDEAKKKNFRKCMAIAAILHDMGYYDNTQANSFGTRNIRHEERSMAFVADKATELGLQNHEAQMISAMIEGTMFGKKIEALPLSDEKLTAEKAGAALLGVLDILCADDNYIRNVALGLHEEFKKDKAILAEQMASSPEDEAIKTEHDRIPLAADRLEQVKASRGFLEYAVKGRVNKTGLIAVEIVDGKVEMASNYIPAEILEVARKNWQAIYDYADRGIVPEEIRDLK